MIISLVALVAIGCARYFEEIGSTAMTISFSMQADGTCLRGRAGIGPLLGADATKTTHLPGFRGILGVLKGNEGQNYVLTDVAAVSDDFAARCRCVRPHLHLWVGM